MPLQKISAFYDALSTETEVIARYVDICDIYQPSPEVQASRIILNRWIAKKRPVYNREENPRKTWGKIRQKVNISNGAIIKPGGVQRNSRIDSLSIKLGLEPLIKHTYIGL